MKLGMNIVTTIFTFVISFACATGCATSTEPTTDDDSTGERTEVPPSVIDETITPAATQCGKYTPAMCAMAIQKCPNPRLGGTYCYIAQQCVGCY